MPYPISLCMIVRNEEKVLARCLQSVQEIVSEIIIIDTGSSDNSIQIANDFGAKVYQEQWENDFSKARNSSIEKASLPWVLVLDADEQIIDIDLIRLGTAITHSCGAAEIHILNTFSRNGEQFVESSNLIRMFTRDHFRYKGRVHEQITAIEQNQHAEFVFSGIKVQHDGYADERIMETVKFNRNLELLTKEIEQTGGSPYNYYQLGKTYFVHKDYLEAKDAYEKALQSSASLPKRLRHSLAADYGYVLKELQQVNEAINFIAGKIHEFPTSSDLWFLLALLYTQRGLKQDIESVISCYQKCLELGDSKEYDTVRGTGSFLAAQNLGLLLKLLGDHELSEEFLAHSERLKQIF